MKFKVNVGLLLEAVNRVMATVDTAASKGAGKPGSISSSKLYLWAKKSADASVQVLYLYSTNMTAESFVKIEAEIETEGETLIDPEHLRGGLAKRNSEETAVVELVGADKARKIRVKIGKSQFHLGYDPQGTDYMRDKVKLIPFKAAPAFTMLGSDMTEFVRRGMFCIPNEDDGTNRYRLGGLKIVGKDEGYIAQATDGHIAARIRIKGEKKSSLNSVIVPQKSLPALNQLIQRRKDEDIEIIEGGRNSHGDISKMFFKMGDAIFGTLLLDGTFPDVDAVINMQNPTHWFHVDRIQLRDALQRTAAFDRENGHVTVKLEGNVLSLRSRSDGGDIEDAIEVQRISGPDTSVSVTVNMHYLTSIASGSAGENLKVGINQIKGQAIVVEDTADENVDSRYAVMPVRN